MAKRCIVVGAGVIGASIAYHLARAGADVVIVDALPEAGGAATPASWAWINASWGNSKDYVALRMHSMLEWRRIDRDVPGMNVNWCGGLLWDLPDEKLMAFVEEHQSWGYDVRLVDRPEAGAIEPNLREVPRLAAHAPGEASVEPRDAALKLISAAQTYGADFSPATRVKWIEEVDGKVTGIATTEGSLSGDEIILASGIETAALLEPLGIAVPLIQPPGLLVHSKPASELINGLVLAPELHVRQTAEGRLIAGSDFGGSPVDDDPQAVADTLFAKLQNLLHDGRSLEFEGYTIGLRPTPADGHPILGRSSKIANLYVAVTHSGITLAPAIGEIAQQEILNGAQNKLIAPYGLGRFN